MLQTIWKYILIAAVCGICYFFLAYHILLFGREPVILKKSELTLSETFVNIKVDDLVSPKDILEDHPESRRDGMGEVLVERGILTYDELAVIEEELEAQQYE